jgi:hypothetical protein
MNIFKWFIKNKSTQKLETNIIRFAVGSPKNIQSWVWRMWVQGDDVYLGARDALQAFKVSLHKSGVWRIAFVKELEREDQVSDRVIIKWKTPGEFAPGWTPSIAVLISSIRPEKSFDADKIDDPQIRWFSTPKQNNKLIFKVLFSKPNLSEQDFRKVTISDDRLVARMVKANKEIVWLVVREEPLTSIELEKIKDVMQKTKIHLKPGSTENIVHNSRGLLVVSENNPGISTQPTILDIPFGKENLDIPSS